ncbi:ferrous iron transport protein B [Thermosynechococcaceae cyanobacterium BACA0444]|uniref:Ferrous iron transport protein B n=1 Tax=Pseudocalidococcus azoricus BACA0444 TaxID=2918990 RepID=A0AAE4K160_9CYAN|nr:ferrous iron transport protein B [Pseudocalidococcus azoricus]MDS3862497.1 ferrous iron transport protein B [Pseudocalidococcus azoricus BACA0444]
MSTCHSGAVAVPTHQATKRIALLGMPNTGKSTLFNRMTGARAFVGNWPGMTVDLLQAVIPLGEEMVEFVDLPGIYDLNGFSEDEAVVQRFLAEFPLNLILIILNAAQIDRQVRLALQVKALGLPAIVLLNLSDEAKRFGIEIHGPTLAQNLGMSVCLLSAKYGQGYAQALAEITCTLREQETAYQVANLQDCLTNNGSLNQDITTVLAEAVVFPSQLRRTVTASLDRLFLHPIWGIPLFFTVMFGLFMVIWQVGLPSQDVMGNITDWLNQTLLQPLISPLPHVIQDLITNGLWNGLATVASFLPLVVIFFFVMAAIEDSGYLSRAAYLMDAFMGRLGLDGRGFVMQMLGFGCNVPALMGTRVMRSQALRWLTMLIIPFSLCSARLQVFVFILAAVLPGMKGAVALFGLYVLSFVAAFLAAAIFSQSQQLKNHEPFILELPPYRLPTLKHVLLRGWGEVREFLYRASGFITLGCLGVWTITNLPPGATGLDTIGGQIGKLLVPIMAPVGIDPQLTLALIFGFVAKEIVVGSLAVIYAMNASAVSQAIAASVTVPQALSFCIFCLLYTPCLTTVAVLKSESKSWGLTLFSLVFSLGYAWLMSFIFYQVSLGLHWA